MTEVMAEASKKEYVFDPVAGRKILSPGLFDSDDNNDKEKENKNNNNSKTQTLLSQEKTKQKKNVHTEIVMKNEVFFSLFSKKSKF